MFSLNDEIIIVNSYSVMGIIMGMIWKIGPEKIFGNLIFVFLSIQKVHGRGKEDGPGKFCRKNFMEIEI